MPGSWWIRSRRCRSWERASKRQDPSVAYSGTWTQGNLNRAWSLGTAATSQRQRRDRERRSPSTGHPVSWIGCRKMQITASPTCNQDAVFVAEIDTFFADPQEGYKHHLRGQGIGGRGDAYVDDRGDGAAKPGPRPLGTSWSMHSTFAHEAEPSVTPPTLAPFSPPAPGGLRDEARLLVAAPTPSR